MAGGALAAVVPCMVCLDEGRVAPAKRIQEGDESDQYECDSGHGFGIDWSSGAAERPSWPPSPELAVLAGSPKEARR